MGYTIPIGPYHPALEELIYVRLFVEGETIKDAEIRIGYNHRGIEKLAAQRDFLQTLILVERVCGICSNSHPLCLCMGLEAIAGIPVSKRARYIRVIMSELERIHSHLLWAGIAAHLIGFESLFMEIFQGRENIMDILEMISGNRVNYAMNIIGGVRRDLDPEQKLQVLKALEILEEKLKPIINVFLEDKTIALRTRNVGILTKEKAIDYAVVGPFARASGICEDIRKTAPYSSYEDFDFQVIVREECDVWARAVVRLLEIKESIKILRQALENLPDGPINPGKLPQIPAGETLSRLEAPRGENVHYIVTDGTDHLKRLQIRVPTYMNAPSIVEPLKGQTVADSGLIIASMDPCFSCMDR
ncbi:MAG: rane-bound hydrogenase subunit alpha [Thermoanaerobacteraceae bacterium]|jgi:Ni,Fe-hydrogenase III large subunit|nr:rane-bound hydrogenase subunit alpha [Thermoanaerobacteraceae bacterium]